MSLVFVFGTLKEGFPNFGTNKGRRLPGTFVTTKRYPFYLVGARRVPWMVDSPGQGHHVSGQIFAVDEATLAAMDSLEGVTEPDGYRRLEIEVTSQSPEGASPVTVFAYLKAPLQLAGAAIMSGQLSEYTLADAALYSRRPA